MSDMQYSWEKAFEHVEEAGPQRVVKFFKIALGQMARLEAQFASKAEHDKARQETIALFNRVHLEMQKTLQASKLDPEDFTKAVKKHQNFTSEEWRLLARIPELIGEHHKDLFARQAFQTPKKKSPYFKV